MYRNHRNMNYVLLFSCSIYTSFTVKFDFDAQTYTIAKE